MFQQLDIVSQIEGYIAQQYANYQYAQFMSWLNSLFTQQNATTFIIAGIILMVLGLLGKEVSVLILFIGFVILILGIVSFLGYGGIL